MTVPTYLQSLRARLKAKWWDARRIVWDRDRMSYSERELLAKRLWMEGYREGWQDGEKAAVLRRLDAEMRYEQMAGEGER